MTKVLFFVGIILLFISGLGYWSESRLTNAASVALSEIDLQWQLERALNTNSTGINPNLASVKRLQAIDEQAQAGKYSAALGAYMPLLQKMPKEPSLLFRVGLMHLQLGQTSTAEVFLRDVYEQKEARFATEAAWCLALIALQQEEEQLAKPLLEEIIAEKGRYYKDAQELLDLMA